MFNWQKKESMQQIDSDAIVAVTEGMMSDISTVNDETFAQKLLGNGVAIETEAESAVICSPAEGILAALFPTGHAFGIKMPNGVEVLVHIGIDTVNENGAGFQLLNKKKGDNVHAGDPIVKVDMKTLKKKYEMPVMVIITNSNQKHIEFINFGHVCLNQPIIK